MLVSSQTVCDVSFSDREQPEVPAAAAAAEMQRPGSSQSRRAWGSMDQGGGAVNPAMDSWGPWTKEEEPSIRRWMTMISCHQRWRVRYMQRSSRRARHHLVHRHNQPDAGAPSLVEFAVSQFPFASDLLLFYATADELLQKYLKILYGWCLMHR